MNALNCLPDRPRSVQANLMLARYYSSSLGRFMEVDPKTSSARRKNPQTWNRYTYALNNPLQYVDESGEDIKLAPGLAATDSEYIIKGLTNLYATPTGKAIIDKLEASKVVVTIGTKDLGFVTKSHGGAHAE